MPDQEFKILITGDASSGVEAIKKASVALGDLKSDVIALSVSEEDVARATGSAGEKAEETGKKVEDAGEKAGRSGEKHRTLRRMMGELDRICPGLGSAMELVSSAYLDAGESAEVGTAGTASFNVALKEVLVTLGPLIVGLLAIEAAMQYWDSYKEKVKAAAEAQEEAAKRIVDSTHEALKAVQELDEAMHPKQHNTAESDEAYLKEQQRELENAYNRQRGLNKANEEKELSGAGSAEEKEQIKKRFNVLDVQLNDWRDKQKAAIEGTMVGTMETQLKQLKDEENKLIKKIKPEFQMGKETGDMTGYNKTKDELQKNADEAKALREKLEDLTGQQSTDAGNAAFNSETNRQVFQVGGQKYTAPGAGYMMPAADAGQDFAANKFAEGKGIADTSANGGKVSPEQQQFLVVLEQSITGQKLTFSQAVALIEAQSKNQEVAASLISNAHSRIDAVGDRLKQLQAQVRQISYGTH